MTLDDGAIDAAIRRLLDAKLLRELGLNSYGCHPLVRGYYLERVQRDQSLARTLHERIRDYYLAAGGATSRQTFEVLAPFIEAVYHGCQAGAYDEACRVLRDMVYRGEHRTLINRFGAYDTAVEILDQFFPDRNLEREPLVQDPQYRRWIFDEIGLSFMSLGRLQLATPFFERERVVAEQLRDISIISTAYQNLAEAHAYLGELDKSAGAAAQAVGFAPDNAWPKCYSLSRQGWAAHLRGRIEEAREAYEAADRLQLLLDGSHLYHQRGVQFATFLCRIGDRSRARSLTTHNLETAKSNGWIRIIGQCHRILGDLDAGEGQDAGAHSHYEEALKSARRASHLPALIEALLARGSWMAAQREGDAGRADLEEALTYAVEGDYYGRGDVTLRYAEAGGYQIYEADIRIGLAKSLLATGDRPAADAELARAKRISEEVGYHWGTVDVAAVSVD